MRRQSAQFIGWLQGTDAQHAHLERAAETLETYLLHALSSRERGELLVSHLTRALRHCDEPIYSQPLVAEAYAFLHFLERYRRFWRILIELTAASALPLARHGVRVLDVGAGPGPSLYATSDFYSELHAFAGAHAPDLSIPPPTLECVESGSSMRGFIHLFSELGRRSGPFGARFSDFRGIDFVEERRWLRQQYLRQADYDEVMVWPGEADFEGEFRYRLFIFSNFFTRSDQAAELDAEFTGILRDMRPGAVVVVVGGTTTRWAPIYQMLAEASRKAGVDQVSAVPDRIVMPNDDADAARIKASYLVVVDRLRAFGLDAAVREQLPSNPKYWDPSAPYTSSPFGLWVYRKGGPRERRAAARAHRSTIARRDGD